MRSLILTTVVFSFLMAFTGCTPDEDGGTGGGTPDVVAKFLGTWHVTDYKAKINYDVTIEADPYSGTKIVLKNFAGIGGSILGDILGDAVVIDKQTVNGYSIEGSGSYKNKNTLNFSFLLSDGIDEELRKAEFTR